MKGSSVLQFHRRRILPMIYQQERMDCAYACVVMVCQYWGHRIDLERMKGKLAARHLGVTLKDIDFLFEQLQCATRALSIPLEALSKVKCPAILHWNMNHFVVLKKVKRNKVVLHDPALGIRYCSMEEVGNAFTGVVLEVEPIDAFVALRQEKKFGLWDLFKTVQGLNKYMILALLLSLVIEILSITNPLFMQYMTDDVIAYGEKSNIYLCAGGFLLLLLLYVMSDYLRGIMLIYVTSNVSEKLSSRVFQHVLQLPLEFFERRHKGDVQSKFQALHHIQKKITTDFITTVLDGFMMFITFILMLIYSLFLSSMVLFALFLYLSMRYISYQQLKRETSTSIHQHAKAMTVFLQTLQGIVPIKTFLKERVRFNMWQNTNIDSLNADIQVSKLKVLYQGAHQFLFQCEHILVVCVGAFFILDHHMSLGMLLAFLAFRSLLLQRVISFVDNIVDYQLISIQMSRLSDILLQEPEEHTERLVSTTLSLKGALRLENVSFRYHPSEAYIFHHLNFMVEPGEKVAIVGRSGSGKTTLLKVMMGLLPNTEGTFYVDTFSLQDFGLIPYRNAIAAVMQDDVLLPGSIMENIAFFDTSIDLTKVFEVSAMACIHDEIMCLPMGYETLVGDMGSCLSGGQKQRILLARALYKSPKILFLDEATSHLDSENERKINHALKKLAITQIVIAHRPDTIKMADRILHLE